MKENANQNAMKKDVKKIIVNGKSHTMYFNTEPNKEIAQQIKKVLLDSYLIEIK